MRRIWRLKHFEFEDFTHDESGVVGEGDNALTLPAKRNIEEFVVRFLDPLWEAWDRICAFNGWMRGINIRTAYIRKGVCDILPKKYRWYYWGYTAEIYPANGRMEDFVNLLKFYSIYSQRHFSKIQVFAEYVCIEYKNYKGRMDRNFEYSV